MKRGYICFTSFILLLTVLISGCGEGKPQVTDTVEGNLISYHALEDGTWEAEGNRYRYRLEITGRMHGAAKDSTFVYLSNIAEIPFDRAWKAAGFSSNTGDYFDPEDAILVEWK